MKKYSFKNLLVCLYICTVIYLFWGYFTNSPLKSYGFYTFLDNYFGVTIFIIAIIFFINLVGNSIVCKKKRTVFKVRLFFFEVLIGSVGILYFAKHIGVTFTKNYATVEQLRYLTEIGLYKYKIGLFFIFLLDWIFAKSFGMYMYIVIYFLIFISAFFLFAKMIRVTITRIIRNIKEKRRLKRERELIREQLRLKAYYEKLEREKELARQKQLELEEQIRLERLMMEQIGQEELDEEDIEEDSENLSEEKSVEIEETEEKIEEIENDDVTSDSETEKLDTEMATVEVTETEEIIVTDENIELLEEEETLEIKEEDIKTSDTEETEDFENLNEEKSAEIVKTEEVEEKIEEKLETKEELDLIKKLAQQKEEQPNDTSL